MKVEVEKKEAPRKRRIDYSDLENMAVRQSMRDLVADQLPYNLSDMGCSDAYDIFTDVVARTADDLLVSTTVSASRPWISLETLKLIERRNAARLRRDRDLYMIWGKQVK